MKKAKTPGIVTTAIITTITLFTWIIFSVYRALTTTPPVNVPPEILVPLSPELDTQALAHLAERLYFEEGQTQPILIPEEVPEPTITPTSTPLESPTPEATPSAIPTP